MEWHVSRFDVPGWQKGSHPFGGGAYKHCHHPPPPESSDPYPAARFKYHGPWYMYDDRWFSHPCNETRFSVLYIYIYQLTLRVTHSDYLTSSDCSVDMTTECDKQLKKFVDIIKVIKTDL